MSAQPVLDEFRKRRNLLSNAGDRVADQRLRAMWGFLKANDETREIIAGVPPFEKLIKDASPEKPVAAGEPSEVFGVGLYVMKTCAEGGKKLTEIVHGLGIATRGERTAQRYIDEGMNAFVYPTLDYIEEKLVKLEDEERKEKDKRRESNIEQVASNDIAQNATAYGEANYDEDVYEGGDDFREDGGHNSFEKVRNMMPRLFEEMRNDFNSKKGRFVREFIVLRNKRVPFNPAKKRFVYYTEDHEDLKNKIDILENYGYVTDVTVGNTPIYRISEEFFELLQEQGKGTDKNDYDSRSSTDLNKQKADTKDKEDLAESDWASLSEIIEILKNFHKSKKTIKDFEAAKSALPPIAKTYDILCRCKGSCGAKTTDVISWIGSAAREGTGYRQALLNDFASPEVIADLENWQEKQKGHSKYGDRKYGEDVYGGGSQEEKESGNEESIEKSGEEPTVREGSIAGSGISDRPSEIDVLGFEPYTNAIFQFLLHEDTKPPLTLSIEGEWGSGKTSFMLQLQKKLREAGGIIVNFSPWRHDTEDKLWAAFAMGFLRQITKKMGFIKRTRANVKLKCRRFDWGEGWTSFVKKVGLVVIWLVITSGLIVLVSRGVPLDKKGDIVFPGWIASLGVIAGALFAVLGKVKDFIGNPLEVDLRRYMKTPDYVNRISFIEKFHADFKHIVQSYAEDKRVYVFIDDLDRCAVPKAAELMESINLMISEEPNLVFVIGMDREKVAAGLAVKHEKLLPYLSGAKEEAMQLRGVRYGYSFIEKFIQLPFQIPRPTDLDVINLLKMISGKEAERSDVARVEKNGKSDLENKGGLSERGKATGSMSGATEKKREFFRLTVAGDSPEVIEIVRMVAPFLNYNPRRIKQFLNIFRLRAFIASETGLFFGENQFKTLTFPQLGKYIGMTMIWPSLVNDLSEHPRLFKELTGIEGEKDIEGKPDYVRGWYRDRKFMELFDYAPDKKDGEAESLEDVRYMLLYLDVEQLLRISPKVIRVDEPADVGAEERIQVAEVAEVSVDGGDAKDVEEIALDAGDTSAKREAAGKEEAGGEDAANIAGDIGIEDEKEELFEDAVNQGGADGEPVLSQEARELLLEAANDKNGSIVRSRTMSGTSIGTNGREFVDRQDPRTVAKWEHAVDELGENDFIEDRGYKGEVFAVTHKGYAFADKLQGMM